MGDNTTMASPIPYMNDKMIKVTVKTLESRNHMFQVEDTLTIAQFKTRIAHTVGIPAVRQRIIYCGRVLQDDAKLVDCDLDGKVVHLVQRVPPGSGPRIHRSLTPPPDLNRARGGFRGFDRVGNTVYMGMSSMAIPPSILDPQQMIPPRATHTLSSSRLNVARRMLRQAENVIRQLENPNGEEGPLQPEEPTEEEMTPIIEARVIVPTNPNQPIDGNAIINAVQNTIFPPSNDLDSRTGPGTSASTTEAAGTQQQSASAPGTPRTFSTENLTPDGNRNEPQQSRLRCGGAQMAALVATLNQLQFRFGPFLARYQAFMQSDPPVSAEAMRETRQMLTRVSQVMHFFGHAYHSLSDIIIVPSHPPPRALLCRPILIQPPAMVQAGIPIQLEAQINLSADRPVTTSSSTTTTSSTGTTTNSPTVGATENLNATATEAQPTVPPQPQPPVQPSVNVQPGFVGFPFVPGSMRVFTTPIEIRPIRTNASRRPMNINNNVPAAAPPAPPPDGFFNPFRLRNQPPPEQTAGSNAPSGPAPDAPPPAGTNGRELEFVMDVTPEDLRGGNLIQSLMQIVGNHLGDTIAQAQNQHAAGGAVPTEPPSNDQGAQPSQARSTQTNPPAGAPPRTAPRPHVHMTQQAVQGGFDPFLHCYSHHVCQSRPQRIVTVEPQNQQQPARGPNEAGTTTPSSQAGAQHASAFPEAANLGNMRAQVSDFLRLFSTAQSVTQHSSPVAQPPSDSLPASNSGAPSASSRIPRGANSNPSGAPDGPTQHATPSDIFAFINGLMQRDLPDLLENGPTLDVFVQSFNQEPYMEGEHLIIDLIMLMLRNLRVNDLFLISGGNLTPFHRQMAIIQRFFRVQVCCSDTSEAGISRATERVMFDLRPVTAALESIPTRENINMEKTVLGFFRQRVPGIIRLAIESSEQEAAAFFSAIFQAVRELVALAIHCCASGQQGVETVCEEIMFSTLLNQSDILDELQRFTIDNSRTALRNFFQNLRVNSADIEQYIVRNEPLEVRPRAESAQEDRNSGSDPVESMEVDATSPANAESVLMPPPIRVEDTESLPNVIWGSEAWHTQTPEEWVPLIARDIQRQRKQNAQPPFSDAYISGMPSKRRKLISNSKPQGSVSQTICESLRQVITNAGLASAAPLDIVAQAAGESPEIQSAYGTLLQSTVQANLSTNDDFNPERYPNTAAYFRDFSPQ